MGLTEAVRAPLEAENFRLRLLLGRALWDIAQHSADYHHATPQSLVDELTREARFPLPLAPQHDEGYS